MARAASASTAPRTPPCRCDATRSRPNATPAALDAAATPGVRKNPATTAANGVNPGAPPDASASAAQVTSTVEAAGFRRPHTNHQAAMREKASTARGSTEKRGVALTMSMSQPARARAEPICGAIAAPTPMPTEVMARTRASPTCRSPKRVQDTAVTAMPLTAPRAHARALG